MNTTARGTSAAPGARPHRLAGCLQPPGQRYRIEPVRAGENGRDVLERYVQAAFAAKHGATVRSFMPTLLGFRDGGGTVCGVLGVRGADQGRLYLEQYLDRPIEQALEATRQSRHLPIVRRGDVAEVGNLASANCRAAMRMIAHLPAWLVTQRYRWIVFTATSALRQVLTGVGAPLVELARADGACVDGQRDEWGRYYETDPRVFAGFLADAATLNGFARWGHGA